MNFNNPFGENFVHNIRLVRNPLITQEANSFSKIPVVKIHDIIVGLYYQNNNTTGVWE